jgi:hypothetical protein
MTSMLRLLPVYNPSISSRYICASRDATRPFSRGCLHICMHHVFNKASVMDVLSVYVPDICCQHRRWAIGDARDAKYGVVSVAHVEQHGISLPSTVLHRLTRSSVYERSKCVQLGIAYRAHTCRTQLHVARLTSLDSELPAPPTCNCSGPPM